MPFAAVKRFFDPSVQFGLQFEEMREDAPTTPTPATEVPANEIASARRPNTRRGPPTVARCPPPANPPPGGDPDKPAGGAEVVRLDRFRKK